MSKARLKELREKQANIATNARAKYDEITDDTPEERASEIETEFDAMMSDYDKIGKDIERLERSERALDLINQPDPRRPLGNDIIVPTNDPGNAPDYRTVFHSYLGAQGQLGMLSPEERAILQAGFAEADVKPEHRAQTSSTNSEGGFTVPEELQNILIKSMAMWGPMYDADICTTINTTSGNNLPMPTVNDTANTGAAAPAQGTTLTDDGGKDVTFGQKQLESYSFDTEWIRVSLELAQDSIFAMEELLGNLLGERLGRTANSQLTTGTGSSAPNGIVTASSLGVTAAGANAITWDETIDLEHSVDPAYRQSPKCRWMFNDGTLKALRKLKDGDGNYLWQMGDVTKGVPASFNGRPYSINQAMASLATGNKTMLFGDFGKYFVRKVGTVLIGALQDKDFWPGFGVAGYIRFDGELGDTAAVKHLIQA